MKQRRRLLLLLWREVERASGSKLSGVNHCHLEMVLLIGTVKKGIIADTT